MRFIATADTDIGNTKSTNQDSVLIEHASTPAGEVLMTVICDGMGGLSKGELASATVIRAFKAWFDKILPFELVEPISITPICWIPTRGNSMSMKLTRATMSSFSRRSAAASAAFRKKARITS